jgi:hypothetical protein
MAILFFRGYIYTVNGISWIFAMGLYLGGHSAGKPA